MIAEPGLGKNSRPCGVSGCTAVSRYECPRCHLPYCTASCYGAHSKACVDAFSRETDLRLKGVKTSEWERRRFNNIVEKIRDAGFYGGSYEDPVLEDRDQEETVEEITEKDEEGADEEELPELLEQFMDSLDDDGKKLVFSMISKGMLERYEENKREAEETASMAKGAEAPGEKPRISDVDKDKTDKPQTSPPDTAETLEDLVHDMEANDLSYEQILERLPQGMARDIEARLRDGRASRLLKLWCPWWIIRSKNDMIETTGDGDVQQEEGEMPPLPTSDQLLVPVHVPRKGASSFIMYNVIDVLAAYCMSLRLCNGDWASDPSHVARKIWELSPVLSEDRRYMSIDDACGWSVGKILHVDKSTEAAIEALNDVSAVISGRSEWVARALFECQQILEAAREETSPSGRKHLKARIRKVAYFVSWALCQDTQSFVTASRAVLSYAEAERGRCEEVKIAEQVVRLAKNSEEGGHRITVLP